MLQRQVVLDTGHLDVSPFLMVLGVALCALAGVTMRVVDPAIRWIGVPLVVSAWRGVVGWIGADLVGRRGELCQRAGPSRHATGADSWGCRIFGG